MDKTIAISHAVEKEVLAKIKDSDKVTTIYNAVDLTRFSLTTKQFDPHNVILGNVARFYPAKKGQDILIDVTKELKKNSSLNIKCLFAGAVAQNQNQEEIFNDINQ